MNNNIEYVVTAEFHIDKGPSLMHQYPEQLPGIENLYFLPELMLPDQIHKREEDFTLFLLFKHKKTLQFQYLYDEACEAEPYYLYSLVNNTKDASVKRGSVIKALAIVTKLSYFKNFKPLMLICLDMYFRTDDVSHLKNLYDSINKNQFDMKQSMSIIKKLLITSILDLPINDKIYYDETFRKKVLGLSGEKNESLFIRKDLSSNSIIQFNKMNIPIRIPLLSLPDTIGDYFNPTDLNFKPNLINILNAKLGTNVFNNELTTYGLQTPPIIILINAFLTGKKIIVLSYDNSSGYIIDHILVLLKIITGGGILSGLMNKYNVFPMIDVSKIDLLDRCDSFIAGTINPFFKNNDRLWDVLYDIDSNEVSISSQIGIVDDGDALRSSIIAEDAKFLSNLQLSLFNYNDDLTTLQLIFRRHINEMVRILLSSKNLAADPSAEGRTLLMEGTGYYWGSDSSKLVEISCYQSVSKKFQSLIYEGKLTYSLALPNLTNELNLIMDLHYHLQRLHSVHPSNNDKTNEHEVWYNIRKYLVSGKSLETLMLITYLIPPTQSTSLQSTSTQGRNVTIFDKNKGVELLLINLFNSDDRVKSSIIMILQELYDNFLCGWCLDKFVKSNLIYEMAFNELTSKTQ